MEYPNRTKLIVNYIPIHFSESGFRRLFESIGPVKTAKIIRNYNTATSRGFGFIEFHHPADAAEALRSLNGTSVQHKKIKVSYARGRDDAIKRATIYIKGIPRHWAERQLMTLTSEYGEIISLRLLKERYTRDNLNRGVAFVLYAERIQAEDAIKKLNGKVLAKDIGPITVAFAKEVGNSHAVPMDAVLDGERGVPTEVLQTTSRTSDRHAAREAQHPRTPLGPLPNPMLDIPDGYGSSIFNDEETDAKNYTIFVYNIGTYTRETVIHELFSLHGHVERVKVCRHFSGRSRRFAFVTMSNYSEAVNAIQKMNGSDFFGKTLQVSFKTEE